MPTVTSPLALATMHDRAIGCIIGSALGDAIGLYTEFLSATEAASAYPSGCFSLLPRVRIIGASSNSNSSGGHPPDFTVEPATPLRVDMHRLPHAHGDWTDDTDHALLILLGVLHGSSTPDPTANKPGKLTINPRDLPPRLAVWVAQGLRALDALPLGLGRTVGSVVRSRDPEYLSDPEGAARKYWASRGRDVASNGSLMRTHVVGVACSGSGDGDLARSRDQCFELAAAYSAVTHADPRCVVACVIGSALVRGLVRGEVACEEDIDETIEAAVAWYDNQRTARLLRSGGDAESHVEDDPPLDLDELRRHTAADAVPDLPALHLDDAVRMGYVYKTLGAGVLLLRQAFRRLQGGSERGRLQPSIVDQLTLFESLMTPLVLAGGDADTNACFAGALLGALLGYRSLPPHWRDGLRHGAWLLSKAEALAAVLGLVAHNIFRYDGASDPDTEVYGGRQSLTKDDMDARWSALTAEATRRYDEHKKARESGGKVNSGGVRKKGDDGGDSATRGTFSAQLGVLWKRAKE